MISSIQQRLANYRPQPLGQMHTYAVLIPLIQTEKGWEILYQIRADHISQPGEVAFPGGRIEAGETAQAAAQRETREELNLTDEAIKILGQIDYLIQGHRTIYCFVGQLLIEDWHQLTPNHEVDRLFTIPVKQLQNQPPKYYQLSSSITLDSNFPFERLPNGHQYAFHKNMSAIPFYEGLEENLWGLTAQFTHRFIELLGQTADES